MWEPAAEKDDLVTSAMAHWGARFVSNGVVLTDFEEVTGSLDHGMIGARAWSARAAITRNRT